jgi:hypothetical protein
VIAQSSQRHLDKRTSHDCSVRALAQLFEVVLVFWTQRGAFLR